MEGFEGWDDYAPFYDWENRRTLGRRDVPFWRNLALQAGGPVLELGCGTARVSLPLARAGVPLTGIDRSAAMLAFARTRLRRARLAAQVDLVQGDIRYLPFASARCGPEGPPLRTLMSGPEGPPLRTAMSGREGPPLRTPMTRREGPPLRTPMTRREGPPLRTPMRGPGGSPLRTSVSAKAGRSNVAAGLQPRGGDSGFAAVIAPYGILQSLLREKDLASTLAEVHRVLRPGGTFGLELVADLPSWEEYRRRVSLRGWRGRPGGAHVTLVETVRQDRARGRTIFDQEFTERRGRERRVRRFSLAFRTLTVPQMARRLEAAGFAITALLGDYRGRAWDDRADMWLILARRSL